MIPILMIQNSLMLNQNLIWMVLVSFDNPFFKHSTHYRGNTTGLAGQVMARPYIRLKNVRLYRTSCIGRLTTVL